MGADFPDLLSSLHPLTKSAEIGLKARQVLPLLKPEGDTIGSAVVASGP